jgi:hypothetical protein
VFAKTLFAAEGAENRPPREAAELRSSPLGAADFGVFGGEKEGSGMNATSAGRLFGKYM